MEPSHLKNNGICLQFLLLFYSISYILFSWNDSWTATALIILKAENLLEIETVNNILFYKII